MLRFTDYTYCKARHHFETIEKVSHLRMILRRVRYDSRRQAETPYRIFIIFTSFFS